MKLIFRNKRITGVLSILPGNEVRFDDEIDHYNFSRANSLKLKKLMGYDKRRIVDEKTLISNLCICGLEHLFQEGLLNKEDIDALILVTQTPDYIIPPTSYVIHGELGLKQDMICMDINQGCAGYLVGLIQAFALLENESVHKVVLLNADILSKKVSPRDRNSYPLVGDAASVTLVEKDDDWEKTFINIKADGRGRQALIIPAGGMKMPSSLETAEMNTDEDQNVRSLNDLKMDGRGVFEFVMREVPALIDEILEYAGVSKDQIDFFMFHQPNKFMLQKLADRMQLSYEKMPNNIVENFGNASGVTIPLNICYNLSHKAKEELYTLCLSGFGVGLTWSAMVLKMGKLDFCHIIEY